MNTSCITPEPLPEKTVFPRRLSVAPMMEYTDRHCRYFLRTLSMHTLLYTEMVSANALVFGKRTDLLEFSAKEHPIALQLGGCDPDILAESSVLAQQYGYDEVNLNVGCPSARVQEGGIGACLMAKPDLVAQCVKAMQKEVDIPVTVKHRTGIQSKRSGNCTGYTTLQRFVETVAAIGCNTFIVHARIGILEGLSPKENRSIPPLDYPAVYQLKQDYPALEIIINGGISTLDDTLGHLNHVDGVMIGRAAYHNPYMLVQADRLVFNDYDIPLKQRPDVLNEMAPYIKKQLARGVRLHQITRHVQGLFHGLPGARFFRHRLGEMAGNRQAGMDEYLDFLDRFRNHQNN